jgi:hypothetical protein
MTRDILLIPALARRVHRWISGHLDKFKKMHKDQRDQTSDTLKINKS